MARLGAHFRFFVRKKISEDPAWQRPTIIFSGKIVKLSSIVCNEQHHLQGS